MAQSRKPTATFSNKINNNASFSGSKILYDDVYGGPPKFGVSNLSPRFEDYGEIFGSFHTARASSIPVLDLPSVHDAEAFFDPRTGAFNYTEVFGALDFAVPFENLFRDHHGVSEEEEEAWTVAETDSFSGESDRSANNQSMYNGDLFHSVEGNKGFNILYHNKVDGTSNERKSKGKTRMTQLHDVPGFSQVYDETRQLRQADPFFQAADDTDLDIEFSADKVKANHPRKTMANQRNLASGEQTFDGDLNHQNGGSRNVSHTSEMFITVSDISLRSMPSQVPPPARPPPVVDAKKGDIRGFHSNSRPVASEETSGSGSPPFFDMEDHMNSCATASAEVKETMLRTEAKLRSAKELQERKKWDCESHLKSSYDIKVNEAMMSKDVTRSNSLNDETAKGSYDRRHSKLKFSDERQKLKKASPETLDNLEGKKVLKMFEDKNPMEPRSSQESDRSSGIGTWKDESEFFELAGMEESRMAIQPTNRSKNLVQGTGTQKHGQRETEASNVQEKHKQVEATEENYQGEEYEKIYKAAKEACEHDENIMKSEALNGKWRQREHMKKEKMSEVFELEDNEKSVKLASQNGKTKKITEADKSKNVEDVFETVGHREHNVKIQKSKEVDTPTPKPIIRGNEKKLKEIEKQQRCVKRQKQSQKIKENGEAQREAFALGQTEDEEKLKGSVELEYVDERPNVTFESGYTEEKEACKGENETRLKLAKQIQIKKGLKEDHERVEIEKRLKSSANEENDEGLVSAFRSDENEKQLKEDFELEVNETRLNEASEQRVNEAYERDQNRKKFEDVYGGHGEVNILKEACNSKGIEEVMNQTSGQEHINGMLNEAQTEKFIERTSSQTFAREGSVTVSNENSHLEQSENMYKDVGGMETDKGQDRALDDMERNEEGGKMKNAKVTDKAWEIEIDVDQSVSIHEEFIGKLKVSKESFADQDIGKMRTECRVGEKKLKDIWMENQPANQKNGAPEMVVGDSEHLGIQSEMVDETVKMADYKRSTEAAEPAMVQETVNFQKTPQCVDQSMESKAKSVNETPAIVKDAESMRKERKSEKDHLRKIEEERDSEREKDRMDVDKAMLEAEREREREKDRMAVDSATFEARDRAYAEACERAERAERAAFERATVEARYKALAEARERLEKACAEARDKSYIDKEITEARLKAERAGVERATAEAQERATEKLKVERTVFESSERLERSVSDNFGGRQDSSSSDMLDQQFQNFSSSSGSRHPYSLYGAATFSVRSEREGESAQRCRARLERHRRTAERAAKALAEKNMRDLLAQKEQAERNRLAETLDAEVRRWSSGKEGNLRALLSTLQYILGPDSGWQPIPLTEVITSVAVKKAYRKATLCVHPDKLQQRGASIQHKYICEKVFDLLKDAWNRYNSEER